MEIYIVFWNLLRFFFFFTFILIETLPAPFYEARISLERVSPQQPPAYRR